MTILSRILLFFPAFYVLSVLAVLGASLFFLVHGSLFQAFVFLACFFVVTYLLPVFLFRIHQLIFPLKEGVESLTSLEAKPRYNVWWGGHQFQIPFVAFPILESAIRLFPGAFTIWLRLWGAKVGRSVYWTPQLELLDRSLLDIGDDCIFGHDVSLCAHIITPTKSGLRLYVKTIFVGKGCLVGGKCKLGPGVVVEPGVRLAYGTLGWINQVFKLETVPGDKDV